MRKAKAYINGKLERIMPAAAVTEATRHAYEWRCIENGCDCTMHWRKAVHAKANTDLRDPTFAKNPSSAHKAGCVRDFTRILHENIDYVTVKNGQIHVRVNFPLGSSSIDRFPQRGHLTAEMKRAAEGQKDVKPYSSIKDLAAFIEENLGGLDADAAGEVIVDYQGKEVEWGKLFKPSDAYEKLYLRANTRKGVNEGTSPIITIVRPIKEILPNGNGKRRFECEFQQVKIPEYAKRQKVIPVIVCDSHDPVVSDKVEKTMRDSSIMIIAARPYQPKDEESSAPAHFGKQQISLYIHKVEQIASVDPKYWKLGYQPAVQLDLFGKSGPNPPG